MCEPMLKIRDIMCKKAAIAKEDTLIQDAVMTLNEIHVGSIIIVNDEQKCVEVFTERDAIRSFAQKVPMD